MRRLLLLLALALAGCGQLPQPFFGNPGPTASRLAQLAPPGRLAIPSPDQSLLPDEAASAWAGAIAKALQEQEIPASHTDPRGGDWSLALTAELRGPSVVPAYTIRNPSGEPQGTQEGAPIPAAAWASGNPDILKQTSEEAAPKLLSMLTAIEAARLQSDPHSLLNRPARVYLAGVTGAPGDGNQSLPRFMKMKLENLGIIVQDKPDNADYQLRGEVKTAQGAGGTTRIELQWIVEDSRGERGRVVQLNEVPPGSLNGLWGEVADAATSEAAGGVQNVLTNASKPPSAEPKRTTASQ